MLNADGSDDDLERLLQEHEALQAENEALRKETKDHAVAFESDEEAIEPSADEEAAWLQVRIEALRREREALQNLLSLADELQSLERTNVTLREATGQLEEENSKLHAERTALQAASRPSSRGSHPSSPLNPLAVGSQGDGPHGILERRVHDLTVSLGHRDQDVLVSGSQQQRKEIIGAMLRAGLFDPLGQEEHPIAASYTASTPSRVSTGAAASPTIVPATAAVGQVHKARSTGPSASPLLPASMGIGKETDILQAARRGDVTKQERKELIAEMLKTGLFCAPPGPILATAADERAMDLTLMPAPVPKFQPYDLNGIRPESADVPVKPNPIEDPESRRLRRFARESAIRGKLEKMR
jgi:hypothetical protein